MIYLGEIPTTPIGQTGLDAALVALARTCELYAQRHRDRVAELQTERERFLASWRGPFTDEAAALEADPFQARRAIDYALAAKQGELFRIDREIRNTEYVANALDRKSPRGRRGRIAVHRRGPPGPALVGPEFRAGRRGQAPRPVAV